MTCGINLISLPMHSPLLRAAITFLEKPQSTIYSNRICLTFISKSCTTVILTKWVTGDTWTITKARTHHHCLNWLLLVCLILHSWCLSNPHLHVDSTTQLWRYCAFRFDINAKIDASHVCACQYSKGTGMSYWPATSRLDLEANVNSGVRSGRAIFCWASWQNDANAARSRT